MSVVSSRVILKYLYYNNYTGKPSYGSDIASLGISLAINNTGRLTWINTKVLDYESGMDYWLEQTIYYDRYGRVVQEVQDNHLNGVDYITNKYDFTGQVIQTRYRHTADGTTTYTDQYNDFDHRGRIIKVRHRINGGNELLLAGSNYNEAGELVDKYLHSVSGGTFLQRNDYLYNVRGWLTEINSPATFSENDQFGLKLYYNSAPTGGAAKYNGNIKTLNRSSIAGSYIDQLTYQYSGNKITGLKDDSGDIANTVDYPGSTSTLSFNYDNNGNVTGEPHKQITLDYNLINLPRAINLNGQNRYIYYYYTFDGEKLRKTVENNGVITKTDYCGPFVYETVSGTRSLKYIITSEGRAVKNGSSWDYEYNLKDHLGNVRVVIHKNSSDVAEPIQERHYYPYGMEMSSLSTGSSSNKYLYNGKELQDGLNLDWYDYGARFYDPQIGRWSVIDGKAEKYASFTPYAYALNNPMIFIDPDGNEVKLINAVNRDRNGNYVYESGVSGKTQKVLTNIVKTEEGRNYIGQFAKADQVIGGYKFESNGAYSDHDLIIQDISLTKYSGGQFPTWDGWNVTRLNEKEGKVETYIQLNSANLNERNLAETAAEEMMLHGFRDTKDIDAYKSGGKDGFNKSHGADPGGRKDHEAFNKSDTKHEGFVKYDKMRDQLIKVSPEYQQAFDDARKTGK